MPQEEAVRLQAGSGNTCKTVSCISKWSFAESGAANRKAGKPFTRVLEKNWATGKKAIRQQLEAQCSHCFLMTADTAELEEAVDSS